MTLSSITDSYGTPHLLASLLFFICVWYILVLSKKRSTADDGAYRPLPKVDIGAIPFIIKLIGSTGPEFITKIARELDAYIYEPPLSTPNRPCVFIGDHTLARMILDNHKNEKPHRSYSYFDTLANGATFFAHNGHRANHVRKATAATFSPKNMNRMNGIIEKVLEKWIEERLEPLYVQSGTPIDVDTEMVVITTDVIFQAAFDYSLSLEERTEFSSSINSALEVYMPTSAKLGLRTLLKKIPILSWAFSDVRKAFRGSKKCLDMCQKIIAEYRHQKSPNTNTLIHFIVTDEEYESDQERSRDLVLYIFAGFETTAHAIAWTFVELAKKTKEQDKLRKALMACHSREEARHCKQLKNVTKETLRLHTPAALGSVRQLEQDLCYKPSSSVLTRGNKGQKDEESKPFMFRKGTTTFMPFYLILRNHFIFQEPDEYLPGRWDDATDDMLKAFLPFAAGRRNCQGQALANSEMLIILEQLVTRYEFCLLDEGRSHYMVTLKVAGSKLIVKKVQQETQRL